MRADSLITGEVTSKITGGVTEGVLEGIMIDRGELLIIVTGGRITEGMNRGLVTTDIVGGLVGMVEDPMAMIRVGDLITTRGVLMEIIEDLMEMIGDLITKEELIGMKVHLMEMNEELIEMIEDFHEMTGVPMVLIEDPLEMQGDLTEMMQHLEGIIRIMIIAIKVQAIIMKRAMAIVVDITRNLIATNTAVKEVVSIVTLEVKIIEGRMEVVNEADKAAATSSSFPLTTPRISTI